MVTMDPSGSCRSSLAPVVNSLPSGSQSMEYPIGWLAGSRVSMTSAPAVQVNCHDLPVDPVAEPQPPLMPPRRLRNPQPAQHNLRFKHDAPLLCSLHERPPARSTAAGTR